MILVKGFTTYSSVEQVFTKEQNELATALERELRAMGFWTLVERLPTNDMGKLALDNLRRFYESSDETTH